MAYNDQIEDLIEAALADGVLTEKEREVLFKKAKEKGIDLDEFEMVLEGRLHMKQQEMKKEQAQAQAPAKSSKYGEVRKCPSCGAPVKSFQTSCSECGTEFHNSAALSKAAEDFVAKCQAFDVKIAEEIKHRGFFDDESSLTSTQKQKQEFIATYPIPTNREDMLELLILMSNNIQELSFFEALSPSRDRTITQWNKTWLQKMSYIRDKAAITMANDKEGFAPFDQAYKIAKKRCRKSQYSIGITFLVIILLLFASPYIMGFMFKWLDKLF